MNYNTSSRTKLKFKTSPSKNALDELNKKGITIYDKMGNPVNSPVTAVKKAEETIASRYQSGPNVSLEFLINNNGYGKAVIDNKEILLSALGLDSVVETEN